MTAAKRGDTPVIAFGWAKTPQQSAAIPCRLLSVQYRGDLDLVELIVDGGSDGRKKRPQERRLALWISPELAASLGALVNKTRASALPSREAPCPKCGELTIYGEGDSPKELCAHCGLREMKAGAR